MLNKNTETILGCNGGFAQSEIVVFGAPFDSTTSYRPGARFGPKAIRSESFGLETYSVYQDADLEDYEILDSGDLELCIGSSEKALDAIEERSELILKSGKLPFMLGGEHLVTLGSIRAAVRKFPDLHIIHFDAHADLREEYLGEPLSHACVLRRCHELLGDGRIFQFGIRSGDREEWKFSRERHVRTHAFTLHAGELEACIGALQGAPVYFTVDLDVLDPSVFPGTGTPEPGGVDFETLRRAVTYVCTNANVVAADLNELSPMLDPSGISTAAACKVLREMLLALAKKKAN